MTPDDTAWFPPPPRPSLAPGHVHVWRLALDRTPAAVAALAALLSPDEHARAAQLQRAGDGGRWAVARARLRQVLAAYVGCPPGALSFAVDAAGKPRLIGPGPAATDGPAFNLSHSEGVAVIALTAGSRVGVDVEAVRPRAALAAIAARYFEPAEQAYLAALPDAARAEAFYALWTAKEAVTKGLGAGLSAGFRRFAVRIDDDGGVALAPGAASVLGGGWTLRRLDAGPGHAAALAVDHPAPALACFDGPIG